MKLSDRDQTSIALFVPKCAHFKHFYMHLTFISWKAKRTRQSLAKRRNTRGFDVLANFNNYATRHCWSVSHSTDKMLFTCDVHAERQVCVSVTGLYARFISIICRIIAAVLLLLFKVMFSFFMAMGVGDFDRFVDIAFHKFFFSCKKERIMYPEKEKQRVWCFGSCLHKIWVRALSVGAYLNSKIFGSSEPKAHIENTQ